MAAWLLCIGLTAPPLLAEDWDSLPNLTMDCASATAWADGNWDVSLLEGPVRIQMGENELSGDRAVVWVQRRADSVLQRRIVQVYLKGNAKATDGTNVRSGAKLFVDSRVKGPVLLNSSRRAFADRSVDALVVEGAKGRVAEDLETPRPAGVRGGDVDATTQPVTGAGASPKGSLRFQAHTVETVASGKGVVVLLKGGVVLVYTDSRGVAEMACEQAVLFPGAKAPDDARALRAGNAVGWAESVFLDGDVRIHFTPPGGEAESHRLEAAQVFYDLANHQALLTKVVLHTAAIGKTTVPLVLRAESARQLSESRFSADRATLSTSSMATPALRLGAKSVHVRTPAAGAITSDDPLLVARGLTLDLYGQPVAYWPKASANSPNAGLFRSLSVGSDSRTGPRVQTEWGLFESLGKPKPLESDAVWRMDYHLDRGPALGLYGDYRNDWISKVLKDPVSATGKFDLYLLSDRGDDKLGGDRREVTPKSEIRGHVLWEHQQFLPENWQMQLRAFYASDPTFEESWYGDDFDSRLGLDTSVYLRRNQGSEVLTLLVSGQASRSVTTGDHLQELAEVQRLPEIGYHRIGEPVLGGWATLVSMNTVSGLSVTRSEWDATQLGFQPGQDRGRPSYGQNGYADGHLWRGDFRQEVALPLDMGTFRLTPYVFGRYMPYTDSPDGTSAERLIGGAGTRISWVQWKVDDSAKSELFDIYRVRHVVEPGINFFVAGESHQSDEVYVYDDSVDTVRSFSAIELSLRQRWQTQRGGPRDLHSADFLTLDISAGFFFDEPPDKWREPTGWRGSFLESLPEASLARDYLKAEGTWAVTEVVTLGAGGEWNLDDTRLNLANFDATVRHDPKLWYSLGTRYVEPFDSWASNLGAEYQVSREYRMRVETSYDWTADHFSSSRVTVTRRFDQFWVWVGVNYDWAEKDTGVSIGLWTVGIGRRDKPVTDGY